MWRARDKELELDSRPRDISKNSSRPRSEKHHNGHVEVRLQSRHEENERVCASRLKSRPEENDKISASRLKSRQKENVKVSASLCSSSKLAYEDSYPNEDGMQDEEIEKFLHSRRKRGKGAIGSRMDEPGPYLSTSLNDNERLLLPEDVREKEEWEKRIVGPEKPSFMQTKEHLNDSHNSTDSEDDTHLYEKHHVKKHTSKKDKSKKKKRKERRSKHHNKKQKIR
ncbi:hypothetical protein IHE45_16G047700 [Dioscorea alata]|nr:hypothetical protein IHE45_16G047700 [Dioscorea alata]